MSIMKIRKATKKDAERISKIIIRNLKEVNSKDYSKGVINNLISQYSKKDILMYMKESYIIVVEDSEEILGTGRLKDDWILDVYVLPEYHRKGIGKLLMEKLEGIAVKNNYSEVKLPSSKTAINFYNKLGYNLTDKKRKESLMMVKEL